MMTLSEGRSGKWHSALMLHAMALAVQDHYYDVHLGPIQKSGTMESCLLKRMTHREYSTGCHGDDGCLKGMRHEHDCTSLPRDAPTFCGVPGSKPWEEMLSANIDY